MRKRGGYGKNLKHRFGFFPFLPKSEKKRLWIQAVSVGEVNAISRLIALLGEEYEIVLTTTTPTAQKIIGDKLSQYVLFHGYFPWDFWLFSRMAWRRIEPDAIILVESELWPEHILQAEKRQVPIFLVNARLSDYSFKYYRAFPRLARWIFEKLNFILASSEQNYERIASFYGKTIENFGNMKFDVPIAPLSEGEQKLLGKELGFPEDAFVLMGCSTWPGEEAMLVKAFRKIQEKRNEQFEGKLALLLVPRHAERRRELIQYLESEHLTFSRRSQGISTQNVEVCLADTTGELSRLIQIADLAYVGKSLAPNEGGQNPLDGAMAGIPIIYGNRMTNFRDMCEQLEVENAAIKVESEKEAIDAIVELFENAQKRQVLAKNIGNWFRRNQGASEKTRDFIHSQLQYSE
ncbi:MAG: hypothetical protein LBI77_01475 [Puniceicoccales bacterium]|nr:hypothetical protein [Puniceicoccales bacterium]